MSRGEAEFEPQRSGWRDYLLACLSVAVATALSEAWRTLLNHHRNFDMPYLIAVLLIGTWTGKKPALVAAILSFISYNLFMVQPTYQLRIHDADLLPIGTFLATALLVGGMAGQLSDRARSAVQRLRQLTILLDVNRDLSGAASKSEVADCLTRHFKVAGKFESAIWSINSGNRVLIAKTDGCVPPIMDGAFSPISVKGSAVASYLIPLTAGRIQVGMVVIWTDRTTISDAERHWLETIAQLGAIALDRANLAAEISEARLIAEHERMRTALLSSVSRGLLAPISSIIESASSITNMGDRLDHSNHLELLGSIQDQAEQLDRYVANLLDMTRLETGALTVKRSLVDPAEALSSAIEHMRRRLLAIHITRSFEAPGVFVMADAALLQRALLNILENSLAFSAPGSRLRVGVTPNAREVVISISDEGPGIPADELPRIFDKLFRGSPGQRKPVGIGLGLSVVRGLIETFNGRVTVESPIANSRGARFSIILPAHASEHA